VWPWRRRLSAADAELRARLHAAWQSPSCPVCGAPAGRACAATFDPDAVDGLVCISRRPRVLIHAARMAEAVTSGAADQDWTVTQFGSGHVPAILIRQEART
jgi:hypothetical protein